MSEYKEVYTIKKKIKIYCPIRKGKLEIGSEQLDEMNEFTKYILYLIGIGYTVNRISEVVELGEYIVREEVDYIVKIGLVTIENNKYILSELGSLYFNLIKFLEEIKEDINVNVNCFNGLIVDDCEDLIEMDKCKEEVYKLRVKIVKELYLNKNVSNSREYFIRKFQNKIKFHLSDKEVEKLYVKVNFVKGDYIKAICIDKAGTIEETHTEEELNNNDMVLVHSIIPFKFKLSIKELEKYRYIISTLKKIKDFQSNLISEEAYGVISMEKEEQRINSQQQIYYYDVLTQQVTQSIGDTVNSKAISNINSNVEKKINITQSRVKELLSQNEWFNKYNFENIIEELEGIEYYEPINSLDYI